MHTSAETTSEIDRLVAAAARFLPAQGPIAVFIHHNTLHAFEDRPFEEAVVEAARLLGTEPFLSEARYREELARGRIRMADIDAVLAENEAGAVGRMTAGGRLPLVELHRALLLHAVRDRRSTACGPTSRPRCAGDCSPGAAARRATGAGGTLPTPSCARRSIRRTTGHGPTTSGGSAPTSGMPAWRRHRWPAPVSARCGSRCGSGT